MATASTSLSKVKANSLNLAGTFGFTGTVSGLADETPLVLLSTFTSDGSDSNATFNSSVITSTYKEYLFVFNNLHPGADVATLAFNGSIDNGSNYNVAKTSSGFYAYHNEDDTHADIEYVTAADTAQTTGDAIIGYSISADNDHGVSGIMKLYNPSSTTFVKHFMIRTNDIENTNYMESRFQGGYFNTTSAINNIQFKFSSGEIQGGTIDLFGVV